MEWARARPVLGMASRLAWLGNSGVPEMVGDKFGNPGVDQALKGFKSMRRIFTSHCDSIESFAHGHLIWNAGAGAAG